MTRFAGFVMLIAAFALLIVGCSEGPNPLQSTSVNESQTGAASKLVTPDGDEFISATFFVYVNQSSNQGVNIHRVTSDWVEATVTWNSFGGAYDGTVQGSFMADGVGWRSVDVTGMVEGWMAGMYANFGLLMDQPGDSYPRTVYDSREGANQPYLELCFLTDAGEECTQVVALADALISEFEPDRRFGGGAILLTGQAASGLTDKQSLVRFDVPPLVELAALGDYVWIDMNQDGIQDAGEPGLPGVVVNLYDCQDVFIASMMTDENGFYLFDNLMPGDYYVEFIRPESYAFTMQDQGMDDAMDSDADPTTGKTICTTLEPGETDLTWDAGVYRVPQDGCSLTIGFWKNHAGFGPQDDVLSQYLPIWLGDAGGTKSMYVETAAMAVDILKMKTYGAPDNGITKLYAQLLGTKLNIAAGASDMAVAAAIADADAFLADHDWMDWNKQVKKDVIDWMSMFDDYNNGYIGPGHCDD